MPTDEKMVLVNSELWTRRQVAEHLSVSISTVRRMEGSQLRPIIGDRGQRLFDAGQVVALAQALAKTQAQARPRDTQDRGELAARCFEMFKQRLSLHEIVTTLRMEPRKVRKLYSEWLTGLELGELGRRIPNERAHITGVTLEAFENRLKTLPEGAIRISVALAVRAEELPPEHKDAPVYDELGGFQITGPITSHEIHRRFGLGTFRVSAFSLTSHRMLWEVHVALI